MIYVVALYACIVLRVIVPNCCICACVRAWEFAVGMNVVVSRTKYNLKPAFTHAMIEVAITRHNKWWMVSKMEVGGCNEKIKGYGKQMNGRENKTWQERHRNEVGEIDRGGYQSCPWLGVSNWTCSIQWEHLTDKHSAKWMCYYRPEWHIVCFCFMPYSFVLHIFVQSEPCTLMSRVCAYARMYACGNCEACLFPLASIINGQKQ